MFEDLLEFLEERENENTNDESNDDGDSDFSSLNKFAITAGSSAIAFMAVKLIKTGFKKLDEAFGKTEYFQKEVVQKREETMKKKEEIKEFKKEFKDSSKRFFNKTVDVIKGDINEKGEDISNLNIFQFEEKCKLIRDAYNDKKYTGIKNQLEFVNNIINNESIDSIIHNKEYLNKIDSACLNITTFFVVRNLNKDEPGVIFPEMLSVYTQLNNGDINKLNIESKMLLILGAFYKNIMNQEKDYPEAKIGTNYSVVTGKKKFLKYLISLKSRKGYDIQFNEDNINSLIDKNIIIQDFNEEENLCRGFVFLLNRTTFVRGEYYVYKEEIVYDIMSYEPEKDKWKKIHSDAVEISL